MGADEKLKGAGRPVEPNFGPIEPNFIYPDGMGAAPGPICTCDQVIGWDGTCPVHSTPDPVIEVIDGVALRASDYFQPAPPRPILSIEQIRRLGALQQTQDGPDRALAEFVADQAARYKDHSREELVEELLRRDRQLALEGRALGDGRTAGRLLREFVRGILYQADHATLRQIGDASKAGQIEAILQALGAEPADARELRLRGHMLGGEYLDGSGELTVEQVLAAEVDTFARPDLKPGKVVANEHRDE